MFTRRTAAQYCAARRVASSVRARGGGGAARVRGNRRVSTCRTRCPPKIAARAVRPRCTLSRADRALMHLQFNERY